MELGSTRDRRLTNRTFASDRVPGRPWHPPALAFGLPLELTVPGVGSLEAEDVRWRPSYRIIASEWAGESLFDRLVGEEESDDVRAIADLTNPQTLAEMGEVELVPSGDQHFGPGSGLIMAAFTWPRMPSRFSDGSRGTYYAAREEETAVRETVHHDEIFLAGSGDVVVEKTVIEAELDATLVDVRTGRPAPPGLDHRTDYSAGQAFGGDVRRLGGDGILYHSVRHRAPDVGPLGECAAVFRPSVLRDAVAARTMEYHWDGSRITLAR